MGTDGSYWGDAALAWAAQHACAIGAELDVHQADPRFMDIPADIPVDAGIGDTLRSMPHLPVRILRSGPDPISTLVSASASADMIVLGCRGHHHGTLGLGHSVIPVVARSRCDTVVVRGLPATLRGRSRWITAVVRGSREDASVVERAARLATVLLGRVRVVQVSPPTVIQAEDPASTLERARVQLAESAPRMTVELRSMAGQPLEAAAACADTDLLVLGVGSALHGDRTRLDPMTKAALYHSRCPVLITRS
ncbi:MULTISPECIES: universal stress protein [Kutzneria]|uniref:universal stress protein n=1 Tax=Kutzneria TaxID=43356 RepID=UPI00046D02BA|nr:universal stress protein [Kutzneria albida]